MPVCQMPLWRKGDLFYNHIPTGLTWVGESLPDSSPLFPRAFGLVKILFVWHGVVEMGTLGKSLEWVVWRTTPAGNKSACPAAWPAMSSLGAAGGGVRSSPAGRARMRCYDLSPGLDFPLGCPKDKLRY